MEIKPPGRSTGSRNYALAFKRQVIAETNDPGKSIAEVALAHGLNANMVSRWRRTLSAPNPTVTSDGGFVPVRVPPEARRDSSVVVEHGATRIRFEGTIDAAALRTVLGILRSIS